MISALGRGEAGNANALDDDDGGAGEDHRHQVDPGEDDGIEPMDGPLGRLRADDAGDDAARHDEGDGLRTVGLVGDVGRGEAVVPGERR
jgi:hypothetical protein